MYEAKLYPKTYLRDTYITFESNAFCKSETYKTNPRWISTVKYASWLFILLKHYYLFYRLLRRTRNIARKLLIHGVLHVLGGVGWRGLGFQLLVITCQNFGTSAISDFIFIEIIALGIKDQVIFSLSKNVIWPQFLDDVIAWKHFQHYKTFVMAGSIIERWIPLTNDQTCGVLVLFCCKARQAPGRWIHLPVIWDTLTLLWSHADGLV